MKLMDKMSVQKDGLDRATSRFFSRKENPPGELVGSQREINASQDWQVPSSIGGYTKMAGESSWTQNLDSAASMFPQAPGWEEDYQDLSAYCAEMSHNMSSVKEDATKSSKYIVQDDELNTPEVCVHKEFDYPSQGNVCRYDTSPTSLFDGESWDTPDNTQKSMNKGGEGVTPVTFESSVCESIQSSDQIEMEVHNNNNNSVINEIWIHTMDHEEEVDSSNDDISSLILEESVHPNIAINMPINSVIEVDLVNQSENEPIETIENDDSIMESSLKYLESLATTMTTNQLVSSQTSINSAPINENINSFIKLETDTCMEVEPQQNYEMPTEVRTNGHIVQSITTPAEVRKDRSQLSLNLADVFREDDLISTPVILESLLADEVPFDKLLDFVQADSPDVKVEVDPTFSTVDFSAVSGSSSSSSSHQNEIKRESEPSGVTDISAINVEIVKPVIIRKSPNGQLSVSQNQGMKSKDEGRRFGRKKIVINKTTKKISITDSRYVLKPATTNKQTTKRKNTEKEVAVPKPRGRPAKEPTPSTSREDDVRPRRPRKVTENSDFDYDICSPSPSKRSRLSSVESDGDRYRELRDKNNEASRKSRLNRKVKEEEMKETARKLEKENQSLRIKAEEMERLVKKLREALIQAVTKKGIKKEDQ